LQNLIIRYLEIGDAEDISRIQESITKEPSTIDYHKIIEEEVKKDNRVNFVAEFNGKVIGYMIAYIIYGGFGLEKAPGWLCSVLIQNIWVWG